MPFQPASLRTRLHPRRIQRSLSVDLTIGMLVILLLIEGAFLYVVYQRQSGVMLAQVESRAEDYAAKLGEVLAVPIWDFDDEQIEKVGQGFLQNDMVHQLRITNNQGDPILVLVNSAVKDPLIRRAADIRYNGQVIGKVEISLSTSSYSQEIIWLRNVLLLVLLCSLIVFFIASGLLLRFFLRKPLNVLAEGMDRIARGNFNQQDHNLSYTELTGIARRFSRMASDIKARENTLMEMNRELQQVNARLHQRFRYEQMLAEISTMAAMSTDFEPFARDSLGLIGEAFGVRWIGLYGRSPEEGDHLELVVEWSAEENTVRPCRLERTGAGPCGQLVAAMAANRAIHISLAGDAGEELSPLGAFDTSVGFLLAFPLFTQQSFYGGILFGHQADQMNGDDVRPLLETAVQIILRRLESNQAREMLRRSEERFREMAEMLPETIFEMDPGGHLTYVNRNGLKQFGYTNADLKNGLNAADMFAPAERPRLQQNIQLIMNGGATRLKEYRALRKDGTRFPTMVSSSAIRKSSQIVGVRGFVIDMSDKKDLEERLRKANRMEAIGNLAAGVAHDLNNILSGLVGYPDLLLLDLPDDSPMRPPMEAIKSTGLRAAAVVQDLLTLARRNISELQVVNLNDIIRGYLDSPEFLRLKQHHDKITLEEDLAGDLMNVRASAHHLSKGFMNLVVNAMEAMPAGGHLTIRTVNRYLDRALSGYEAVPEGEYAVLSVIDVGIGISSDDIRNIFEPFYSKKRMGRSGTGLGMSVVWATVKDHAGFIDVESGEGRGTRFDLYFPATREKASSKPSRVPIEDYLGSERILVVDDILEQRNIAADMLGRLGYTVHTVPSGEAGIEVIRQKAIDLVILDMVMDPGIDGLETYRRMLALVPNQRAIIASGFAGTERVKAAMELGARTYLKKPYSLEKLGLSVRSALDHPQPDPPTSM